MSHTRRVYTRIKGKRQCTIYEPRIAGVPTRCEGVVHKSGRCLEHWRDWRQARDARRIEQREYRAKAKPNARGRITPMVVDRLVTRVRTYFKKQPKTPRDGERIAKAEAKRARKGRAAPRLHTAA